MKQLIFTVFIFTFLSSPFHVRAEEKVPVIIETKDISIPTLNTGERLYQYYCIVCHGTKGNGKGFNAEYLDPKPADHTNIEKMSKRTDEKLFDTIADGGKSVGKSTYMPPWGNTFREKQIESLILYLRKLCNCQGP